MSRESLKEKLKGLTAEQLSNALLEIAGEDDVRLSKVSRLVSDDAENERRFKRRLKDLKQDDRYFGWRQASEFASQLSDLVADVGNLLDPDIGFSLICRFYEADSQVFERCDDSSGSVGDVFRNDAFEVFCKYAQKASNRGLVLNTVISLLAGDDYGARGEIGSQAKNFLSDAELRTFFDLVNDEAKKDTRDRHSWHWQLKSIAEQLKDAPLYEKLVTDGMEGAPHSGQTVGIAKVYLSAGDTGRAQQLIDSIDKKDGFAASEKRDLQKEIYRATANEKALAKVLTAEFKAYPSLGQLEELLKVIGNDHRGPLISQVRTKSKVAQNWEKANARFFHEINDINTLSSLILQHASNIDGRSYYELGSYCESLESNDHFLAASVLYRLLIESTLEKAISKYYHHAVGYLRKLDELEIRISDWHSLASHADYSSELNLKHRLKKSFWSRYDSEKKLRPKPTRKSP